MKEVLVSMPATAIKRHTQLYEAVYGASLKEEAGIFPVGPERLPFVLSPIRKHRWVQWTSDSVLRG